MHDCYRDSTEDSVVGEHYRLFVADAPTGTGLRSVDTPSIDGNANRYFRFFFFYDPSTRGDTCPVRLPAGKR